MARAIDAVQVLNDINWHHKPNPVSDFESGFNNGLNQAMWIITHAPTLTPPNEPLTLEELREMDGEPVWVVPRGMHEKDEPMWCVLESPMALIPGVDYWSWDFDGYAETWIAYRRPPEGEEDA